ncbi:MAG: class I SAM-dependent methyltransferase [Haliscomenobacter sp.]|nr:class I SAM-dependent methyltransferase [Haliscomenobacter sp.]
MSEEINKYGRTADEKIYLEDRYEKPKEMIKQVTSLLVLDTAAYKSKDFRLLDIGGATGEFLYYVRKVNSEIQLDGIEYSDKLVDHSKSFLSKFNIVFEQGDANDLSAVADKTYDFVTTLGVTSIFDDFRPSFSEMIRVAKEGGRCINTMLVNEYDIDVQIKYRTQSGTSFESGWNKFSIASIKKFLTENERVKKVEFIKHTLPFDLPQQDDLMRSWTRIDKDGNRIFWNGLNMEIALYHVCFDLK